VRAWHAIVALAVAIGACAVAAEPDPLAALDKDLAAVGTYDYDQDSAPLRRVADAVVAAGTDVKQCAAIEERLVRALVAGKTAAGKSFLCRQLRMIGTARCVPALEALLPDPKLSHMARYALGRMAAPEASVALHRAMGKTKDKLLAGVINTLADRRYRQVLLDVAKLAGSSDPVVAEAAVRALGRLGGADAVKALQAARAKASGKMRATVIDSLLLCGDQFLADGEKDAAAAIYDSLEAEAKSKRLRLAVLVGLVRARGSKAMPLLVGAIKSSDRTLQGTAIGLAATLEGKEATKTFVSLLPSAPPDAQELLLRALGTRGDPAAAGAVAAAAKSETEAVRIAALEALGSVGDASQIGLLAQTAAAAGAEQSVARASLVALPGDGVDKAILSAAGAGDPKIRVELIRALALRNASSAVGALLAMAKGEADDSVRKEAIRALGALAGAAQCDALVGLAMSPKDEKDRGAVEQAIGVMIRRLPEKPDAPLLARLGGAPAAARPMLVRLLGRTAAPKALAALRTALKDKEAPVRDAAVRALAEWPDPTPADDLLTLARTSDQQTHKVLALRGYVRMAAASRSPTGMYVRAMELAERAEDKRLVLGGLGTADSPEALKLVMAYLKDPALQNEAALAVVQIAGRLQERDKARAREAVKAVLAVIKDPRIRRAAQEIVNEMEKHDAHILVWLASGPYKVKGKDSRGVFAEAFAPEKPDAGDVKWVRLNKGGGAWSFNLEAMYGSLDHCAAYVRTQVWSPVDQDVQIEMGSDDALKAWLNGKSIHANYLNRGCSARQDLVKAKLKKGFNDLMLKVVEHEGGWGFACRIRKPDGSALDGLKYEPRLP